MLCPTSSPVRAMSKPSPGFHRATLRRHDVGTQRKSLTLLLELAVLED